MENSPSRPQSARGRERVVGSVKPKVALEDPLMIPDDPCRSRKSWNTEFKVV